MIFAATVLATVLMSSWSAQAQQPGLSDYYLATVEAEMQANKQEAVAGTWLTQSGGLEVEIASCGQALCGKVSKVLDASAMNAANTAAATPILGKTILEGFTATQPATWSGKIFNRADGATYTCQMRMLSPTELEVTPFKDKPEDGHSQVWTRVSTTVVARSSH